MTRTEEKTATRQRILSACVKLFIEKGYHKTTLSEIVKEAKCSFSSFQNIFHTKDGVLLYLVEVMFASQFDVARKIAPENINPIYIYAVETVIQMTITELNENLRDIYVEAYSNRESAEYIHIHTAEELKKIFKQYNPDYSDGDFYELDIGSSGIMRNYMARPCDQYFTLDKKLTRFLTMSLRAYTVPEKEIDAVVNFVRGINIKEASKKIMNELLQSFALMFDIELLL